MISVREYALMAGGSYISTRADKNQFPLPQNWTELTELRINSSGSGFEATIFQNDSEIVISIPTLWANGCA